MYFWYFLIFKDVWKAHGDAANTQIIKGHSGAILELKWSRDGSTLYSCSTDKTTQVFDVETGGRIRKLKGHASFINSVSTTIRNQELLSTASDDGTIKIWDPRQKLVVKSFETKYPALSTSFNLQGNLVFSAGIDPSIKVCLF